MNTALPTCLRILLLAALFAAAAIPSVRAGDAAGATSPAVAEAADTFEAPGITEITEAAGNLADEAGLQPFTATYDAWNGGHRAGTASMRLAREGAQWRINLDIVGSRGLARLARLDIRQGTLFDETGGHFRPLRQDTRRKALFMGREVEGVYDWQAGLARWTGDIKETRQAPLPLQQGDMSGLLINLAIIRDAEPGRSLSYRFVDGGRVRHHEYTVAESMEAIEVDGLSYEAMRVARSNDGDDETIVWVARGVPTPIRILQREDGQDAIDLRLVAYEGAN